MRDGGRTSRINDRNPDERRNYWPLALSKRKEGGEGGKEERKREEKKKTGRWDERGGSRGGRNIQETGKFMILFQPLQGVNYSNSFTCHMVTVRYIFPAGKECIEFAIPLDGCRKDSRYTE